MTCIHCQGRMQRSKATKIVLLIGSLYSTNKLSLLQNSERFGASG